MKDATAVLIAVAIMLIVMIGLGIFLHRHRNDWGDRSPQPTCDTYQNERLSNIPARCLKYFNGIK